MSDESDRSDASDKSDKRWCGNTYAIPRHNPASQQVYEFSNLRIIEISNYRGSRSNRLNFFNFLTS